MKKAISRFFLYSFITMIIVSFSYPAEDQAKNDSTIIGKIISYDYNSIFAQEPALINLTLPKENMLKIGPLLEKRRVKIGKIYTKTLKQEEYNEEYLTEPRRKKMISIYLGGGVNNINGGDLNKMISDYSEFWENEGDYWYDVFSDYGYDADVNYEPDWKELKWLINLKGELLFNLTPNFSIGLGAEYLTGKSKGTMTSNEDYGLTETWWEMYETYSDTWEPEYKLTAIPITLNIYLFVPVGDMIELFIKGGVGYYFGTLTYNDTSDYDIEWDYDDYYYGDYDYYLYQENSSAEYKAKCNTIGFHGGAGISINLSPNMSFVIEGAYRMVNFKKWVGDASYESSWTYVYEYDYGYGYYYEEDAGSDSDSWKNKKIWYYEYNPTYMEGEYDRMILPDEKPEENDSRKNIRPAEINLNGLCFSAGIKISF